MVSHEHQLCHIIIITRISMQWFGTATGTSLNARVKTTLMSQSSIMQQVYNMICKGSNVLPTIIMVLDHQSLISTCTFVQKINRRFLHIASIAIIINSLAWPKYEVRSFMHAYYGLPFHHRRNSCNLPDSVWKSPCLHVK